MSNNKQSSVEWFAQESWKLRIELEAGKISMGEYANKYYQLKEQAKAMHKEEIKQAIMFGDCRGQIGTYATSEQYYNETFGGAKTKHSEVTMRIELVDYEHTCADGCCTTYGYDVYINGEKIGTTSGYDAMEVVELLNKTFGGNNDNTL